MNTQKMTAQTWLEHFADTGDALPPDALMTRLFSSSNQSKKHWYTRCNNHGGFGRNYPVRDMDCSRCLSKMSKEPTLVLTWAVVRLSTTSPWQWAADRYGRYGRHDRYNESTSEAYAQQSRTELTVLAAELRAAAQTFPDHAALLRRVIDVVDNEIPARADALVWRRRWEVMAALYAPKAGTGAVTVAPTVCFGTSLPLALDAWDGESTRPFDPAAPSTAHLTCAQRFAWMAEVRLSLGRFITAAADHPDSPEAHHPWSDLVMRDIKDAYPWNLDALPEEIVFERSSFDTTKEWLAAEYVAGLTRVSDDVAQAVRDMVAEYGPGRTRMWVMVKVPRPMPERGERLVSTALTWYPTVTSGRTTLHQVPLTVLGMFCEATGTSVAAWQPRCLDSDRQSTLDATLALLGGTGRSLMSAYALACLATGADEGTIYGTPAEDTSMTA